MCKYFKANEDLLHLARKVVCFQKGLQIYLMLKYSCLIDCFVFPFLKYDFMHHIRITAFSEYILQYIFFLLLYLDLHN